jgi:hypothetical protein
LNRLCHQRTRLFHSFSTIILWEHGLLLPSFPNFTQNLTLIRCSKNRSLIFATRRRNTHIISATTSKQLALMRWNRNWCKLKHAQICLFYG